MAGMMLIFDRPGLKAEYFHLGAPWEGRPVYATTAQPKLDSVSQIHDALITEVAFSVRWSGWWWVEQGGDHRFIVDANDSGYFRIDGDTVVDNVGTAKVQRKKGQKTLEPGLHRVEIALIQRHGESHLAIEWTAPGYSLAEATALPSEQLYAGRPVTLRRALRDTLPQWPQSHRQLLGAALTLAAGLLAIYILAAPIDALQQRFAPRLGWANNRGFRVFLLLGLFVLTFLAILPFTGTVRGGDDTAYLIAAKYGTKNWFYSRYAHVYLVKAFVTLSGGNPFLGVRLWWSFIFATTVTSLAVAVRSVGPRLQLRTLTAALFILLSQTVVLGTIGSGFADYSAMMFITAAVAIYMHGLSREHTDTSRHEWHALAVGVLTIGAFRSKEVGAVLLALPLLFLITDGRLDFRRFSRRSLYWTGGIAATFSVLMMLDGWILGDFLFSFPGGRLVETGPMNFPDQLPPRSGSSSWLNVIWRPGGHPALFALRNLWVAVVAAAFAAGLRRRRIEIRLLHFLPIAYLLALIVLYFRMRHPFSGRMLIPIIPVACLMSSLLLFDAGLEEVSWRKLLTPRVLIPAGLASAVIFLIVVPYRLGQLDAADFLPVAALARFGWSPDLFLTGTLMPAVVLTVACLLALVVVGQRAKVVTLVIVFLAFFGLGFEYNRNVLAKHQSAQVGDLLRYPWETFAEQLKSARPKTVQVTTDLQARYRMSAQTRASLAILTLDQRGMHVRMSRDLPIDVDVAIASRFIYNRWLREVPALANTAETDPSGVLVFLRPREAMKKHFAASKP